MSAQELGQGEKGNGATENVCSLLTAYVDRPYGSLVRRTISCFFTQSNAIVPGAISSTYQSVAPSLDVVFGDHSAVENV